MIGVGTALQGSETGFHVMDAPNREAEALIRFYKNGGFLLWYSTEGWLTSRNVADWVGVSFADGHVYSFDLSGWVITGEVDFAGLFEALQSCIQIDLQDNPGMTGDFGGVVIPAITRNVRVNSSTPGVAGPDITVSSTFTVGAAIEELNFQECQISAAELTRIITSVHNGIGTYTYELPYLNVNVTDLGPNDIEGGDYDMCLDLVAAGWTVVHSGGTMSP